MKARAGKLILLTLLPGTMTAPPRPPFSASRFTSRRNCAAAFCGPDG
jgi:hypothetical protein